MNARFSLDMTVFNTKLLVEAARAHPDACNFDPGDFYLPDGEVDVAVCLGVLLDPSTLPGCLLFSSQVEITPETEWCAPNGTGECSCRKFGADPTGCERLAESKQTR